MTAPWLQFMTRDRVTIYEAPTVSGERGALVAGTATLGTAVAALVAPLTPKELAETEAVGELRQARARLLVNPDQTVQSGSVIEIEASPAWTAGTRFTVLGRPTVFPIPGSDEASHLECYLREEV